MRGQSHAQYKETLECSWSKTWSQANAGEGFIRDKLKATTELLTLLGQRH